MLYNEKIIYLLGNHDDPKTIVGYLNFYILLIEKISFEKNYKMFEK